jgi:hypothetical protein
MKNIILSIKKAINKKEIPNKYIEGLTLLNPNSGNTSLVYGSPDSEYVYMFTRDNIKTEWLTISWSPNQIGEVVDSFESNSHKLKDIPIYIIKMPFLYPLSKENKRIAIKLSNIFNKARWSGGWNRRNDDVDFISKYLDDKYGEDTETFSPDNFPDIIDNILYGLYDFFSNYSGFSWDISQRQFMQTKDEELILIDPVASNEILSYMHNR